MKKRVGVMPCEGQRCESHSVNAPVVVMENERGTLSYSCDWCGRAPYARAGTGQHAEWREAMRPFPSAVKSPEKDLPKKADQETPPAPRKFGTLLG